MSIEMKGELIFRNLWINYFTNTSLYKGENMDQKLYADTRFAPKNSEENLFYTAVNAVGWGLERGRTCKEDFEEYFRICNFKSDFLKCLFGRVRIIYQTSIILLL